MFCLYKNRRNAMRKEGMLRTQTLALTARKLLKIENSFFSCRSLIPSPFSPFRKVFFLLRKYTLWNHSTVCGLCRKISLDDCRDIFVSSEENFQLSVDLNVKSCPSSISRSKMLTLKFFSENCGIDGKISNCADLMTAGWEINCRFCELNRDKS